MKKSKKPGYYPILINLQRFNCLIVGGGKVAYRKVLSLLKFNADITVISPKISKPILDLAKLNRVKIIKKAYSRDFIEGYGIVFSATDNPDINRTVRKDCTEKGILLNVVDDPLLCDFIIPANVLRGDLSISVSSQGTAPFFTKEMKKKIENQISPVYEDIFNLAAQFRRQILHNKQVNAKTKTKIFKHFALKDWEKIITDNGNKSTQHYINEVLKKFNLL
jgi:siroheme synthase-like protein